jgi:hypothetical protein
MPRADDVANAGEPETVEVAKQLGLRRRFKGPEPDERGLRIDS